MKEPLFTAAGEALPALPGRTTPGPGCGGRAFST